MGKPKAIILEVDGVLSDDSHRRHLIAPNHQDFHELAVRDGWEFDPDYEAYHAACDKDGVNQWCKSICYSVPFMNCHLIFITQRPEKFRKVTDEWFIKAFPNQIGGHVELFMRPYFLPHSCYGCRNDKPELHNKYISEKIDSRPSHEVKREIYEREIRDKCDVLFVLERSGPDAEMYKELALTVLEVR